MPEIEFNINLKKNGKYEGYYCIPYLSKNGKQKEYHYVYGITYEEVYAKLLREKEDYEKEFSIRKYSSLTIQELMNQWLSAISNHVRPGTFSTYQNYIDNYLIPKIGSMYAVEFDKHTMEGVLKAFQKESKSKKELAENTWYLLEEILRLAFKYGRENFLIPPIEFGKAINHRKSKQEVLLLSYQEREQFVRVVQQKEIKIQISVLLPLYIGINLSELCGLKWQDLDLEKGRIKIVRGVKRIQNGKGQKNVSTSLIEYNLKEECREFSLPECAMELLRKAKCPDNIQGNNMEDTFYKELQMEIKQEKRNEYLATLNKKQPEGRTLQYRLDRIGYEAGIGKINFRTLRDTFAVKCLQSGGDIYSLAYVLGIGINAACERYRDWIVRDDGLLKRIG